MTWVKFDDSMPDDDKIANLSDAGFRAYVSAVCFAGRLLTDGTIPKQAAHKLIGSRKSTVLLELLPMLWHERGDLCQSEHCLKAGLCALPSDKYMVHNYLKYNPTREKVLSEREASKQRMFRQRSPEHHANNGRISSDV